MATGNNKTEQLYNEIRRWNTGLSVVTTKNERRRGENRNYRTRGKKRKKVEGILVRECPVCGTRFNTMEQRKIYCSGACKTRSSRANSTRQVYLSSDGL